MQNTPQKPAGPAQVAINNAEVDGAGMGHAEQVLPISSGIDSLNTTAHADMASNVQPLAQTPGSPPPLPTQYLHPDSQRSLRLGEVTVGYALQRAKRRSIGFSVDQQGLVVRAPSWLNVGAIDEALHTKADWIVRKLGEAFVREQQRQSAQLQWCHGALLPYLGGQLQLVCVPSGKVRRRAALLVRAPGGASSVSSASSLPALPPLPSLNVLLPGSATSPISPTSAAASSADAVADSVRQLLASSTPRLPDQLLIDVARDASPEQVRAAVQTWWQAAARSHFMARLEHFAPLLQVKWTSLRLSSAQTRWGSARIDGAIRLHWRLLHYPGAVVDYVVAHELAHLRVMDHSPRFWQTVASVVPDHVVLRRQLRDLPAPQWD